MPDSRSRLRVLYQHPMIGARVEKADHARQTFARRLIDDRDASGLGGGELGGDVVGFEADVMQAFAAAFEELGDTAGR